MDILINTRVTRFSLDHSHKRIESVHLRNNGKQKRVDAKTIILACGGIENARLLLWSAKVFSKGNPFAGGRNELTGKYFMDHLYINPLDVYFHHRMTVESPYWQLYNGRTVNYFWRFPETFTEKHKLARFGVTFQDKQRTEQLVDNTDVKFSDRYFLENGEEYRRTHPTFMFEQSPFEPSQVRLSSQKDRHGLAIAELHWQISQEDLIAYKKSAIMFGATLSHHGNARVRLAKGFDSAGWSELPIGAGAHHMGTTIMSHRSAEGVVDTNCKLFGVENMFVAGSSVFARGDYVNPTLNLVSLASRLSDYLVVTDRSRHRSSYRFGEDEPDNDILQRGWSHVEAEGEWTDGDEATIQFSNPVRLRRLRIFGHGFGKAVVL